MPGAASAVEIGLKGKPFSPECLAADFGGNGSAIALRGVPVLYKAMVASTHPRTQTSFNQWKTLFGAACGQDVDHPSDQIRKLADAHGVARQGLKPAKLLFALHSYYALFLKLLTAKIAAFCHHGHLKSPVPKLPSAGSPPTLQRELAALEAGSVFRRLHRATFLEDDPFAWFTAVWSDPLAQLVRDLRTRLDDYNPATLAADPATSRDLLKPLYQQLFPKKVRHNLGEYYTPDWLAEHVLNELGYDGDPDRRLLDPACGSGTFLIAALNRIKKWHEHNRGRCGYDGADLGRKILANVVGFDLNPLAVLASRTNYLIAIRALVPRVDPVEIPVYLGDSLLTPSECGGKNTIAPSVIDKVDFVVGNPPWVSWDSLPEAYRNRTKALWVRHGLFTLGGTAGRLGGGKKDLAMLFVYESLQRYLRPGGCLGFVMTQSVFKTEGSADGFRRFRLTASDGGEEHFRVTHVDDLSPLKPFDGATNRTALLCVERGRPTTFPLDYVLWQPRQAATIPQAATLEDVEASTRKLALQAVPVYQDRPQAPWLTVSPAVRESITRVLGPSPYRAQAGATTCGADGVFLVRSLANLSRSEVLLENVHDAGKRKLLPRQGRVRAEYLYPVCRGKDIGRWRAAGALLVLMLQDPDRRVGLPQQVLQTHPGTWEFVQGFEQELRARRSSMLPKDPYYSIYGVDRNTFSPYKVVWGRVRNAVAAAVLGARDSLVGRKTVLPFEAMMVPLTSEAEALFLCGCLNSVQAQLVVLGSIVLHPDTHVLRRVAVPRYNPDAPVHQEIVALSQQCHAADATLLEQRLDEACGKLWNITPVETRQIRDCALRLRGADLRRPRARRGAPADAGAS